MPANATYDAQLQGAFQSAFDCYVGRYYNQSLQLCANLLEEHPNWFEARYLEGLLIWRRGDTGEGAARLSAAVKSNPNFKHFHFMDELLRHRGEQRQIEFADERFRQFLKISAIDNFIVSYPKCGRTWVRAVLGKYALGKSDADPLEVLKITHRSPEFPSTEFTHDDYPHWKPAAALDLDKHAYADKSVVLLVRDPRDVVVSYYFEYTKRGSAKRANDEGYNGTISEFLRHPIGGLANIVGFYNSWANSREVPDRFHLVRYEDFVDQPSTAYQNLIKFLRWPQLGESALDAAVEFGQFDNLREIEKSNTLGNFRLGSSDSGDPESFKIRRGKIGGYRDYFDRKDIDFMDAYIAQELDDLYAGYKTVPACLGKPVS